MTVGLRHSYKFFLKNNKSEVTKKEYCNIAEDFLKFISSKLLEGYTVKLPERLGYLYVMGRKIKPVIDKETGQIKGLAPDWRQTKEYWAKNPEAKDKKELLYFLNEHTQQIRYKLFWSKKRIFLNNKYIYSFRFTRANKRALAKLIKEGKEFYTI